MFDPETSSQAPSVAPSQELVASPTSSSTFTDLGSSVPAIGAASFLPSASPSWSAAASIAPTQSDSTTPQPSASPTTSFVPSSVLNFDNSLQSLASHSPSRSPTLAMTNTKSSISPFPTSLTQLAPGKGFSSSHSPSLSPTSNPVELWIKADPVSVGATGTSDLATVPEELVFAAFATVMETLLEAYLGSILKEFKMEITFLQSQKGLIPISTTETLTVVNSYLTVEVDVMLASSDFTSLDSFSSAKMTSLVESFFSGIPSVRLVGALNNEGVNISSIYLATPPATDNVTSNSTEADIHNITGSFNVTGSDVSAVGIGNTTSFPVETNNTSDFNVTDGNYSFVNDTATNATGSVTAEYNNTGTDNMTMNNNTDVSYNNATNITSSPWLSQPYNSSESNSTVSNTSSSGTGLSVESSSQGPFDTGATSFPNVVVSGVTTSAPSSASESANSGGAGSTSWPRTSSSQQSQEHSTPSPTPQTQSSQSSQNAPSQGSSSVTETKSVTNTAFLVGVVSASVIAAVIGAVLYTSHQKKKNKFFHNASASISDSLYLDGTNQSSGGSRFHLPTRLARGTETALSGGTAPISVVSSSHSTSSSRIKPAALQVRRKRQAQSSQVSVGTVESFNTAGFKLNRVEEEKSEEGSQRRMENGPDLVAAATLTSLDGASLSGSIMQKYPEFEFYKKKPAPQKSSVWSVDGLTLEDCDEEAVAAGRRRMRWQDDGSHDSPVGGLPDHRSSSGSTGAGSADSYGFPDIRKV